MSGFRLNESDATFPFDDTFENICIIAALLIVSFISSIRDEYFIVRNNASEISSSQVATNERIIIASHNERRRLERR